MRLFFLLVALSTLFVSLRAGADGPAKSAAAGPPDFVPVAIPTPRSRTVTPRLPSPAPDLSAFDGKKVTGIVVEPEPGTTWDGTEPPVVTHVRVGEDVSGEAARRAIADVMQSGAVARARASFVGDGGGARLVVSVVPRKIIATLRVDLHGSKVDRDEVLREAELTEGGEIVATEVDDTNARIQELYLRHGYPSASVTLKVRATDEPTKVLVLLDVVPGQGWTIQKRFIYLYGADRSELRTTLESYLVGVGDRADQSALVAADNALETRLRAEGYHKATVFHDLGQSSGFFTLRVRIDAGPKFLARFEGNDTYDEEALTAALTLETDADRSTTHLVDKLKVFYVRRGFLDVEVSPDVKDSPTSTIVRFRVRENRRVFVRSRAYPCLRLDEIEKLSGGGPRTASAIGSEIDSFLEEELPGADVLIAPDPRGLDKLLGPAAGQIPTGARATPPHLDPNRTFAPETWDRALAHVQELYRAEGFLHASVGPVQVLRPRCKRTSRAGTCDPEPFAKPIPIDLCTYERPTMIPLPLEPLGDDFTCKPDATKDCAPYVDLLVPVKLGPRTKLYDAIFVGVKAVPEKTLADSVDLPLGEPLNALKVDEARKRIVEFYKNLGYYYVDVKFTFEYSAELTRARVRFDVLEGEIVKVGDILLRGSESTNESLVWKRVTLLKGKPFKASLARETQQNLATLGVFSSVNVALQDPDIPAKSKVVVITVIERQPQYVEVRGGFSTGEGFRGAFEYGHRNILGDAVAVSLRAQLSYLPDVLIFDSDVLANIHAAENQTDPQRHLGAGDRIARRITLSTQLPEIGLGPKARTTFDLIHVQDLERDFALTKFSLFANLVYRASDKVQVSFGQSVEENRIVLFTASNIEQYLAKNAASEDLARLLRVPSGESIAIAQRVVVSWDRRDNAFNPRKGTFLAAGAEYVNSYPLSGPADAAQQRYEGHFFRLTQTFSGYVAVSKSLTFAAQLRLGENVHLTRSPNEATYPDRLFFLGGSDSYRGLHLDALVPQEWVDKIQQKVVSIQQVPIRGGDLMINPRFELRFPLKPPLDAAIFADFGNVWLNASYFTSGNTFYINRLTFRAAVGPGIRVETPVGPIVVDYGINLTRNSAYEDFGALNISIGVF